MKAVYLDQNAVSYLTKSNPQPIWLDIRKALENGFLKQKLICPLPFEGIMETAPRPLELRKAVELFFWRLSNGVAFKPFFEMSNELTLALIRPTSGWVPWIKWKPIWAGMENVALKVTSDWKAEKVRMTARVNAFVRSPNLKTMSERDIVHMVARQRSLWICKDLDYLLARKVDENLMKCPWLIDFLVSERINPPEIEMLKHVIKNHGWAKIPIHAYEILLGAKWEYDSINGGMAAYEPNDEIDRKRAAIALSYTDLFITEGCLADLCRRAKIGNYSSTLVLSVRNPEKILKIIEELIK